MARTATQGGRERILSVAARLFYEQGIRAVGMKQIIDEAGTGKSLLYSHFATKDDLVEAYLEWSGARLGPSAALAREAAGDDPGDRILAIVTDVGHRVLRPGGRGCPFRNYLVEFPEARNEPDAGAADPSGPASLARRTLGASRSVIEELSREHAGPDEGAVLAEQVGLIVDGLYAQAAHRVRTDGEPPVSGVLAAVRLARTLVEAHRRPRAGDDRA